MTRTRKAAPGAVGSTVSAQVFADVSRKPPPVGTVSEVGSTCTGKSRATVLQAKQGINSVTDGA